jgi:hypothetical protein
MTHYYYYTNEKKKFRLKGTPVILPDPLSPHWPIAGFKHLRPEHKILLPKVSLDQVEAYYFTLYMISLSQLVMAEI